MPFEFQRLNIPDVILIKTITAGDNRGFFKETYQLSAFRDSGIPVSFVQDNYSHSIRGVLRGLHYQKDPDGQGKLVMVVEGEIFDVAVDIRKGSPTYGKWVGEKLSAENGLLIYLPPGFAHGFCVLSETADVLYKVSREYAPHQDRGIVWNDPEIAIDWPLAKPILSPKDSRLPFLKDADK